MTKTLDKALELFLVFIVVTILITITVFYQHVTLARQGGVSAMVGATVATGFSYISLIVLSTVVMMLVWYKYYS